MRWDAANARARGLTTHLLQRAELLHAAAAGSWAGAARALGERGRLPLDPGAITTPLELDRGVGRLLAARLALLGSWLGAGRAALAVIYEDEDRRTLRTLLRASAGGASPGARLRQVTPTSGLPERVLAQLAGAESPARLIEQLLHLGHPVARALSAANRQAGTGKAADLTVLWRLETALARVFAVRATRAARSGGPAVRGFAALLIDLENAWALLFADEWGSAVSPEQVFLSGGFALEAARFTTIAALGTAELRRAALEQVFARTPLRGLFGSDSGATAGLEGRARATILAWLRREARLDPLGPAGVLAGIERMRAEAHDVRLVLSAAALGAPPSAIEAELVTPV